LQKKREEGSTNQQGSEVAKRWGNEARGSKVVK
jgi:hypothetical protein